MAEASSSVDERLFEAARTGDAGALTALLDEHPEKLSVRDRPYEWSLLHAAARDGHLGAVDLLLRRGLDVNTRERGDNTTAMHWAAAAGHLDVVRRLVEAGGDIVGEGDDHGLEVIGWATCWDPCQVAVADFLVARGARHHIFSAIAMNLSDEVRRIVASDPSALHRRLTRNENHQTPLHFAVRKHRPEMVALLLALGADPLAGDGSGRSAAEYATASGIDRPLMERIRALTSAELASAARGDRPPRGGMLDLLAAATLGEWETAERLLRGDPRLADSGVLHLAAKRNDLAAGRWLLDHGANPNARWAHWEALVTPLHLAVLGDHPDFVRLLLTAGADPHVRDSEHDSDPVGWAEFFHREEIVRILGAPSPGG